MNAGRIYDANGQPLIQPRNVMIDFDNVANVANVTQENYNMAMGQNNITYSLATPQNKTYTKLLPVRERAIQESQLAVQREIEKKKKLQSFQKKTKLAAK